MILSNDLISSFRTSNDSESSEGLNTLSLNECISIESSLHKLSKSPAGHFLRGIDLYFTCPLFLITASVSTILSSNVRRSRLPLTDFPSWLSESENLILSWGILYSDILLNILPRISGFWEWKTAGRRLARKKSCIIGGADSSADIVFSIVVRLSLTSRFGIILGLMHSIER